MPTLGGTWGRLGGPVSPGPALSGFLPVPFDAGMLSFGLLLAGLWTSGVVVARQPEPARPRLAVPAQ